jgi:hypothetical protein
MEAPEGGPGGIHSIASKEWKDLWIMNRTLEAPRRIATRDFQPIRGLLQFTIRSSDEWYH